MSTPPQIYRFANSLLTSVISSSSEIVGSSDDYARNHYPGKPLQLGESFHIIGNGSLLSNHIRMTVGGVTQNIPLTAGGYTGATLAAHLTAQIVATYGAGYACAWFPTTRKFGFSGVANFSIYWNTDPVTQNLAAVMGYDDSADDTGAQSYESDNAVYTRDYQWAVWNITQADKDTGVAITKVMVYGTNMRSVESIEVFAHTSNLGSNRDPWLGAAIVGEKLTATQSRSNDIYIWTFDGTVEATFFAVFVNRAANTDQLGQDPLHLGCIGIWDDAGFDGDDYGSRSFRAVWDTERVMKDTVSEPPDGGGVDFGVVRGVRQSTVGMGSWPVGAAHGLDGYIDKYRAEASLWQFDPSDYNRDNTLFGYVPPGGYSPVGVKGPHFLRTGTMTVRGIPMEPES